MRLRSVAFAFFTLACVMNAGAQDFPSRPIKLVIGFAPGGAADSIARTLQGPLASALGQPVTIEHKPGDGSTLAAEYVAKGTAPDGHTILVATAAPIVVNPIVSPKAGFDPMRDLTPVSRVSTSPLVIVASPALGASSLRELTQLARKSPGKLSYASSGNVGLPHLAAVLFMRLTNVNLTHVPYKGGEQAVQSLLAGQAQLSFATPPTVLSLLQERKLNALAVTSRTRTALVPGVPGMVEAGLPDYEISYWFGLFVPAGTPDAIVKKLFHATNKALQMPQTIEALAKEGSEAAGSDSPEQFAAFIVQDAKLWTGLVKDSVAKRE